MKYQTIGYCMNCYHKLKWTTDNEMYINGNRVVMCPNCGSYVDCSDMFAGHIESFDEVEEQSDTDESPVQDIGTITQFDIRGPYLVIQRDQVITFPFQKKITNFSQMYNVFGEQRINNEDGSYDIFPKKFINRSTVQSHVKTEQLGLLQYIQQRDQKYPVKAIVTTSDDDDNNNNDEPSL